MEKERYEALVLEITAFDAEDVIATSGGQPGPDPDDPYETPII